MRSMRLALATHLLVVGALGACGSTQTATPSTCAADFQALIAASDYTSSGVGAVGVDGSQTLRVTVDLGGDPALSSSAGRAFFVARDQDAIVELDPHCGAPMTKWSTRDASHAGSTNPQDVAVAPDGSLWIPRYNTPSIAILDAHGAQRPAIDLSPYDDDHNPQASGIAIQDVAGVAKAFVALERLDGDFRSTRPSMMLRIDVATSVVEAQVALAARNPFGLMVPFDGALFLSMPGNFDTLGEPQAGIERFDVATSTTKLLVSESDLGGSVTEVAITNGCGAAIVADATIANATSLVTFDPTSGAVLTKASAGILATGNFDLRGLAWVAQAGGSPLLLVGDRSGATNGHGYAVHVFEKTDACTLHMRTDSVFLAQKPIALHPTN